MKPVSPAWKAWAVLSFCWALSASSPVRADVLRASFAGAIGPASAEWLASAVREANRSGSEALVIELDTPGGLLESTRLLVREISGSSVPVVVYVAPGGARAASAGTFITLAAHVAAMAPGTRIGAAHPVELGKESQGDMREKLENDTAAFIRTIAESRGRNIRWADDAVRKSSSSTEREALAMRVVDLVAPDLAGLLARLDGRNVTTVSGPRTLRTRGIPVRDYPMDWRVKLLAVLTDPNIAYILMMVGIYGILYEVIHPGAVFPGVAGSICLILGLYALQTLPIDIAGLALLGLALVLFAIESQVASGLLGLGGVISLALGSLLLIPKEYPYLKISRSLIAGMAAATGLFVFAAAALALRARKRRAVTGTEAMVGRTARAVTAFRPEGQAVYDGEIWNAAPLPGETVEEGDRLEIVGVDKLKLIVKRAAGPGREGGPGTGKEGA
ncbi:MAG: hypothetical protein A2902_01070 [Elusimicrobia bacterium RIFCSPLOWO2_01_FULL_64_13]|nr:MAG: hypothetical protein A2902_01070 [Elusimicrobia bacterium RIFCSPLOWO2_01_FULL_64_13]